MAILLNKITGFFLLPLRPLTIGMNDKTSIPGVNPLIADRPNLSQSQDRSFGYAGPMEKRGMPDGDERVSHFIAMLTEDNPSRRWKAAESLGRIRDERGVEPLILALADEDWRVRQKAAWALGKIGDPRALLPLRRALLHETEGVKEIIMESLDEIKKAMIS